MLDQGAWFARKLEGGLMRLHLRGQRLVTCPKIKQMFACGYPDDVWTLLANIPEGATRADMIAALRLIVNRNQRGGAAAGSQPCGG